MGKAGFRDADSGILDGESEPHSTRLLFPEGDIDLDMALIGEFDGVAKKVDKYLVQAMGVADQPLRDGGVYAGEELEALLFQPVFEDGGSVVQNVGNAKGNSFDVELAGLDLGKVEDVADDHEKVVNRAFDYLRKFMLFGAEWSTKKEVGHALDAVHWCTNLMAHIGEELFLHPFGFLGFADGELQLVLDFLPAAEISVDLYEDEDKEKGTGDP